MCGMCAFQMGCKLYYYMPWERLSPCGRYEQQSFSADTMRWHLVVLSSPNCGYCWKAKNEFKKAGVADRVPVTWVEYDPPESEEYVRLARERGWHDGSNVFQLERCHERVRMFPVFLFYEGGKRYPRWIVRGWYPERIFPKLERVTGFSFASR